MSANKTLLASVLLASSSLAGAQGHTPQIAIVIDDLCEGKIQETLDIAALKAPIAGAYLPYAAKTPAGKACLEKATKLAKSNGQEVFVHLPVQPVDRRHDAPSGQINVGMQADQIVPILKQAFDAVPRAIGFNNHQGSKGTANRQLMRELAFATAFTQSDRIKYTLDSRTSGKSVMCDAMKDFNVNCAKREGRFLDNVRNENQIYTEIYNGIALSRETGKPVIVIGHHYPETRRVLEKVIPEIREYMIPASEAIKFNR
ncbi:MAG: divergent polysaccharide deacetylase family protein [Rhodospirillales bacterium]|nr:divergent polysaccharide deacetylase family protein [Rhodospirillales bacterium]